MKIEHLFPRKD